ncbi:NAD-dependent epimerase/dehydratase family protein [Kitasatospora sp. DSM 101779]|uniref:NAD-dependent epimerase/dehydratase family protein n=1 Tax=Kitasatospora sp. DSM 101779 TaxID=2853165 RepID=UPI0021D7F1F6|nr:NAD-dependent epimerase/dehydratase family protein [Kitasatospora sp. DSM 101779]MCU7820669.1 NAD-dependent epimerase/dehydratase family protein [Kitasatospora sp. DSM 101779]
MSKHLIVGAGPVGTATARLLADRGEEVTVVTRSGRTAAPLTGVRHLRLDASDADALATAAAGAAVLYNCANPAYHRWATDWPPLAAALLRAAESSGAVLATVGNLYGYGAVDGPMTEDTPLAPNSVKGRVRAKMWQDAETLHRAGRIRATEIRGSDYLGPGAESVLGERVVPRVLAGRGVQVLGDPDTAHSWTYTLDAARLLVAVGSDERAWGRPWHVPSNPPRSQREAVADLARAGGLPPVPVRRIPGAVLALLGLVNPTVRAVRETAYQLERPFVMDSTAAERTFDLAPTPWQEVLAAIVEAHRDPRPA